MERNLLRQVLDGTGGNQAHASRILGITRGNLRKKIRALGLELTIAAPRSGAGPSGGGAAANPRSQVADFHDELADESA